MDLETVYRQLASGQADPGDLAWSRRALQQLALERATTGDPDQRLDALRVAAGLGQKYGLPVAHELALDPDPRVRTLAFNQAVAAREEGLATLRRTATGADPELALAAFELLIQWSDPYGVAAARRALGSPDPRLRRRAVELLGLGAGKGATAELDRLVATDPDEEVRRLAVQAKARALGDEPRPERRTWWDEPEGAGHRGSPEAPAGGASASAPPPTSQVGGLGSAAGAPEEGPASPSGVVAPAAPPQPPEASTPPAALPAVVPAAAAEPLSDEAADGAAPQPGSGRWAALPASMPTETRALTRLLGMVQPADRLVVAAELQGRQGELSTLWFSWRAGGDRALGRGLALSAAALGTAGASSKVALMLGDPDPQVRAAAGEALGAIGAVGAIPALSARIADPEPEVATAAIGGLVALAIRVGRPDLARDVLARIGGSLPEAVAAAVADARTRLE